MESNNQKLQLPAIENLVDFKLHLITAEFVLHLITITNQGDWPLQNRQCHNVTILFTFSINRSV